MSQIEKRLSELGLVLPPVATPGGNYVPFIQSGNQLFIAGQLCFGLDGLILPRHTGKLGQNISLETGQEAARFSALNVLAQAKAALGTLDRITRCIRLFGAISATPDFELASQVMNGASDLMVEVLGDKGRHVRMTIGCILPRNAATEIEGLFEVD